MTFAKGKVVTKKDPLILRSKPSKRAKELARLPKGSLVEISEIDDEWMKVYSHHVNLTGWVWREYIEELPAPQPDVMSAPLGIDPAPTNGLCYWPWLGFAAMMAALMACALLLYWPR